MVSTRRSESNNMARANGQRYQTTATNESRELGSSCDSVNGEQEEEEDEESIEEDSWSSQGKTKILHVRRKGKTPIPKRLRELRSRYVCQEKKFSRLHIEKLDRRNSRRHVQIYSRKMRDMIDSDNDEYYTRRLSRKSYAKMHQSLERRAALSLRPITQKSYKDCDTSTLNCNTDDSVESYGLRRSTRRRRTINHSWLDSNQMVKIGYPNPNAYSDDSRDAEIQPKHSRNSKFLYTFGKVDDKMSRVQPEEKPPRVESPDKENKEGNVNVRFLRRAKEDSQNEGDTTAEKDASDDNVPISELGVGNREATTDTKDKNDNEKDSNSDAQSEEEAAEKVSDVKGVTKEDEASSSENECPNRPRTRMRTRKHKLSTSSSETAVKSYSLRARRPKPIFEETTHQIFPRRRFNHNRRAPSVDSSSDSSPERRHYGSHSKSEQIRSRNDTMLPIAPETLDPQIKFDSVGGLAEHVQCLKEMVLLPMMYPDVFKQFQIQPSRGVLFHGPPGTGKTLLARALANECSFGSKKVSFFMRKGADVLNKWFGESEKQLRKLFEQAAEMKPSIIFFDEIDGLAPVRSSRQDQLHASIVSTLLALMDGLTNRGEIIVIGATNRIDAIDPALRRPGRFDRELYFPLPAQKQREDILRVHLAQWSSPPSDSLISYLAESSVGYCGSDLRALCSEAVIQCFRRTYPQVYSVNHRLLLDSEKVKVEKIDFLRAQTVLVPASHRVSCNVGNKLNGSVQPLLQRPLKHIMSLFESTFPHGTNPNLAKVKMSANIRPAMMLLCADGPEHGINNYLAPALLHEMEHIQSYVLDLGTLYREGGRTPEEACIQIFQEAKRTVPSIIYIPNVDTFWRLVSETVIGIFLTHLQQIRANNPILILATSDKRYEDLPENLAGIFSTYRNEVLEIQVPDDASRMEFFKSLIIDACKRPPRIQRPRSIKCQGLPRAPTPPATPLTQATAKKLYDSEENTLRELRIFLRETCRKLASNRAFYLFTKPVDTEEVPDYQTIIKNPMDLETMMTKVDFHRYECARDFLTDIELICHNALEYNPARTSADKQIRHRACMLRDYAYTLIKNEMDSDFEDKCQEIAKNRQKRKTNISEFLPQYLHTPNDTPAINDEPPVKTEDEPKENGLENGAARQPSRKRKRPSWQRGYVKKSRVKKSNVNDSPNGDKPTSDENSKEALTIDNDETSQNISTEMDGNTMDTLTPNNEILDVSFIVDDLVNPSELYNDLLPLDHDDSLSEDVEVKISHEKLKEALDLATKVTKFQTFNSILDVHFQLSQIIRKYSKTSDRLTLPMELIDELDRYKTMQSAKAIETSAKSLVSQASDICISAFSGQN